MKIIKKGKYTDKVYKCEICGCEFQIEEVDIFIKNELNAQGEMFKKTIIIKCPECSSIVYKETIK